MAWVVATPEISASLPQEVPVEELAFGRTWAIRFPTLSCFSSLDKKGFRMIDTPAVFWLPEVTLKLVSLPSGRLVLGIHCS